jgi:hypothetical protein
MTSKVNLNMGYIAQYVYRRSHLIGQEERVSTTWPSMQTRNSRVPRKRPSTMSPRAPVSTRFLRSIELHELPNPLP